MSLWAVLALVTVPLGVMLVGFWLLSRILVASIEATQKVLDPELPVLIQPEPNQAEDLFLPPWEDWKAPEEENQDG